MIATDSIPRSSFNKGYNDGEDKVVGIHFTWKPDTYKAYRAIHHMFHYVLFQFRPRVHFGKKFWLDHIYEFNSLYSR
jgi:hypothetical protein